MRKENKEPCVLETARMALFISETVCIKKVCIKNGLHQKLFAELLRGFGHYSENGGTIVKTPIILTVNNRIMDKNTVIKFKDLLFDFILLKLNTCYTLLYIY